MLKKSSVSVIVPAHNEEKYLEATLQSVVNQGINQLELIVVPNNCTDKTEEIAYKFTSNVYSIGNKGISLAKNLGYYMSSGEVVIFLDADSQMQEGLIDLINLSLNGKYVAGKVKLIPDDNSLSSKIYFDWVNLCGNLSQVLTYFDSRKNNGSGACLFSRRDILDNLVKKNGYLFNPELKTLEDVELISRLRNEGLFKYIKEKGVVTSTRRFQQDGYVKRFIMDFVEFSNPYEIKSRSDFR